MAQTKNGRERKFIKYKGVKVEKLKTNKQIPNHPRKVTDLMCSHLAIQACL